MIKKSRPMDFTFLLPRGNVFGLLTITYLLNLVELFFCFSY